MTEAQFLATLALVGAVIVVSALLSGLIDRSRLPHAAVFLVLGAVIGPAGLDLLNATKCRASTPNHPKPPLKGCYNSK